MKRSLILLSAGAMVLMTADTAFAVGPPPGVRMGPPAFVTMGPPASVTMGPPASVTMGPPASVTMGPPSSGTLGPPAAALAHIPAGVPLGKPPGVPLGTAASSGNTIGSTVSASARANAQAAAGTHVVQSDALETDVMVADAANELGRLNAAHASPIALQHAAPNSAVGMIATYDNQMNTALALTDPTARDAAITAARQQLALASDKQLTPSAVTRIDDMLGITGASPTLGTTP
jgi:hypothetical protein